MRRSKIRFPLGAWPILKDKLSLLRTQRLRLGAGTALMLSAAFLSGCAGQNVSNQPTSVPAQSSPSGAMPGMQMASSAPSSKPLTAPMDIFKANCARCHVIGTVGRAGGISLDHVGKKKTQAWIETQIRDPASHRTPMPPFSAAQLPDSEMHILAHYLAGLK